MKRPPNGSRSPAIRRVVWLASLMILLVAGIWAIAQRSQSEVRDIHRHAATPRATATAGLPAFPPLTTQSKGDLASDLAHLKAITIPATAAGSSREPRIADAHRTQPDLYARAFVAQLLSQDYSTPRDRFLAWVQAESARTDEPAVTGLIPPELRDRLAIFSVTDEQSGPAPVPGRKDWDQLRTQQAHTTVAVRRVTEPLAWSNAVEAGRVADPGVTAREVAATVTLHTRFGGHAESRTTSVDLTLNLVGPPTREGWAFVSVITYRAVPLGAGS
jgi:hypothetical protein